MPDFTWPDRISSSAADRMPATPLPTHPQLRRLWGILHRYLRRFSRSYCGWVGATYENQIAQLPFGLILKCSDGTEHPDRESVDYAGCQKAHMLQCQSLSLASLLGRVYERLSEKDRSSILRN
ncbi:hypothetical protein GX50_08396 [[Emmonsia] crescens]|uniref:Uncharacterized protein n=1 Tax=[Emmonsia] crescens TaxID=73230 RepID=A0A2B7Z6L9_9EURO|nr:hypothetical protein GX50_08396 [Emmonsia crescens]